jgi:hypothetical protein
MSPVESDLTTTQNATFLETTKKPFMILDEEEEDETQRGILGQTRPTMDLLRSRVPSDRLGALYPGARFEGEQRSGIHSYKVVVHIQYVDLSASFLCGYLHIHGLTMDYPELTTFFEAELIGKKHTFLTRKWDASEEVDRKHWVSFIFLFICLHFSYFTCY